MRGSKLTVSKGWVGRKGPYGKNLTWTHPAYPGVVVTHCGHPTALRPYYIPGFAWAGGGSGVATFRALRQAQWWVEHGGHELAGERAQGELYREMVDIEYGEVAR